MSVLYALCGLFCAVLNDLFMKLVTGKECSKGLFFCLLGIVWLGLCFLFPLDFRNWHATLIWGCISSAFSVSANILLIEAMARQSAGVCSTIYRLNLVPVAIFACLLPGMEESMTGINMLGIGFAVIAVILFASTGTEEGNTPVMKHSARLGLLLVIIASLLRAAMGLSMKYSNIYEADRTGVMIICALFWIIFGLLYAFWRERHLIKIDRHLVRYSFLSGLGVAGIIFFTLAATKEGNASVVLPLLQLSFPLTFMLSVLFLRERICKRKIAAVLLGAAAIICLCL